MADFAGGDGGSNAVNVTTPDGRSMMLPANVAAMFPGLTVTPPDGQQDLSQATDTGAPGAPLALPPSGPGPSPAGGPPGLPGAPVSPWTPGDATAIAAATPADGGPVISPTQVPTPGPAVAPAPAPVTQPGGQAAGTQSVAPTPQLTNAQLAASGPAGVLADQNKAVDEQKAANDKLAQVDASTATRQGEILADRDAKTQTILEERAKAAQANSAELNRRMQERDALATKIANAKIDRSVDHPIWAAIGVALGAVGGAMQQKQFGGQFHNLAFDTVIQQIDRKVAGQMQDLDKQRQALAQMNVGVADRRQINADRISEIDAHRDAVIQQTQQSVNTIAIQLKSPQAIANAQALNAKLDEVRAQDRGVAADRYQAQINSDAARKQAASQFAQSQALQYRGQNLEQSRFEQQLQATREEKAATLAAQMLEKGDALSAKRAQLIGEQGIVDPSTGDMMLTPAGQSKMAQADTYEAQARKAADPDQAQKLNQQAQQYRDSARLNDSAMAVNKKGAEEAQKIVNVSQNLTNNVEAAKRMLQAGPGAFDREKWAQIKVSLTGTKVNYAQTMGERMSPKALEAIDEVTSIDPDSIWSREVDQGKALKALDSLQLQVQQGADVALRGAGVKSGWTPAKHDAAALDFGGKTDQELAADALPAAGGPLDNGTPYNPRLTWIQNNAINPGLSSQKVADSASEAAGQRRGTPTKGIGQSGKIENLPGAQSFYGLDPRVDESVRAAVKRSGTAGHAGYVNIIEDLARPLTNSELTGDKRPGLDTGVAQMIRDLDPTVFADVMKQVKSTAGEVRAKELADAIKRPEFAPPTGHLTPHAQQENADQHAKISAGIPLGTYSSPPSNWGSLSRDGKVKYNERIKSLGFPPVPL